MSDKSLIKPKVKRYDLAELTSTSIEDLQKYYPKIIEAVSKIGEVVSKSQDKVYISIDKAIEIFSDQLKDPNLSEEAKDKLNNHIKDMVEKADQKDSEFKKIMVGLVLLGVGGIGVGGAALALKGPELRRATLNLITKVK